VVELLSELLNKDPSDCIVVPYTSHGRLTSWIKDRFRIRNRRIFWCTVVGISTFLMLSSGTMLSVAIGIPISLLSLIPACQDLYRALDLNTVRSNTLGFASTLSHYSPIDLFFRTVAEQIGNAASVPGNQQFFSGASIVSAVIWILILARLLRLKSHFSLTKKGLRLAWQIPFLLLPGPVVPWSDVKSISFRRAGGDSSPEGFVEFIYDKPKWQYKLGQGAGDLAVNKFSLDLRNLDTLEQRHNLGKAIERWAPPHTVQSDVVENLSATQSHAYTELWLEALTAPSKRQSLEPLLSGKKLQNGKYHIHSQLAAGGQGTAYLAESIDDGAKLSLVKSPVNSGDANSETNGGKLPESSTDNADHIIEIDSADIVVKEFVLPLYVDSNSRKSALRKFLDEADLLKRLDHNRVVKLSDCFVEDHRGYLVLERIYGNSLRQIVLANGPYAEERVLELLDQMLDVLSYLHSQVPPVVHRDFAPDNMILGKDGVLKLVDFNVAQQIENSVVGTIVGKQSYVPPEQLRGMATPASDIYALGASLFFLLTGQDPEPLSVSHPIDVVPQLSKGLDQLIASCTRLDEAERLNSVDEIRAAITIDQYRADTPSIK